MMPGIIGYSILKLDAVDSTNTYASTLLKNQNVPEGLVIQAIEQTAGRGQLGTIWHSTKGESLTFSAILAPSFMAVDQQFYLSMAISLGIYEYMAEKGIVNCSIKWPNDIYIRQNKVCGILIENSILGGTKRLKNSIVGIGINLNQSIDELLPTASSIKAITGTTYHADDELKLLCGWLNMYYLDIQQRKLSKIKKSYLDKLWGHKEYVSIRKDGKEIKIHVMDVEDSGRLVIEDEDKNEMRVSFKEIEWMF